MKAQHHRSILKRIVIPFVAFIGVILHVLLCGESPLINQGFESTMRSWAWAAGSATVGVALSIALGLGIKLIPKYREALLIPITVGIYIGLLLRVVSYAIPEFSQNRYVGTPKQLVQNIDQWQEYRSDAGRFVVLMPCSPVVSSEETPYEGTILITHMATCFLNNDSQIKMIAYQDMPPNFAPFGPEAFLIGAKLTLLEQTKGSLSSESNISVGGHEGKQFAILCDVGDRHFEIEVRVFLVGNRFYKVVAIGDDRSRFLESFQLIG